MLSFKSKITIAILNHYFLNPEARHYINELAKILGLDPKNVYRKLREMEKEGLLKSEFLGKERYYFLAKDYSLLENYRQIFNKTYGLEARLKEIVKKVKGVKEAYVFGSYARNKMDSSSDIDLMVIGGHSVLELQKGISKLQKEVGREINIVNYSIKEFKAKKKQKEQFLINIFRGKYIQLL